MIHHLNMKKMTLPIMLWHQVMKLKLESSETEEANKLLGSLNIRSYDTVDATLAYSKLSATQRRNYLEKRVLPEAIYRRNQLKGYKSSFTKKWQKGEITEEQKNWQHQRIDRSSRSSE